jgi:2-amino-4-hydroxy-6-hydroxymethyldihydropteridine diphosphokinase
MAHVFLGLGSNIERERYLGAGLDAIERLFGHFGFSRVYDSAAVGFDGQPFLNMVVDVRTDLGIGELARVLRHVEVEHGRPANATRFSARQLDIDILLYDDRIGDIEGVELPRGEILYNAFVLRPLAELAPDLVHPVVGETMATLWNRFDSDSQPLWAVDFEWAGRPISRAG